MSVSNTDKERSSDHTFKREERLKSKRLISKIFDEGDSFVIHPFKVLWMKSELKSIYPVQAAFVVSSKKFKRSVDRNLIKRRMKEAYRMGKNDVYNFISTRKEQCAIIFIYIGTNIESYNMIEEKINLSLSRLKSEYAKVHS